MEEKDLEFAELLSAAEVEEGIRQCRAKLPHAPEGFNGNCVHCEEPIPAPRLATGAVTCLECQTVIEWRQRGFQGSGGYRW